MERSNKYKYTFIANTAEQYIVSNLTENAQCDLVVDGESKLETSTEIVYLFELPNGERVKELKQKGFGEIVFLVPDNFDEESKFDVVSYSEMKDKLPIIQTVAVFMFLELCVAKLNTLSKVKGDEEKAKKYDYLMLGLRANYASILDGVGNIIMSWKGISIIDDMISWGAQETSIRNAIMNNIAYERVSRSALKTNVGFFVGRAIYSVDVGDLVYKHAKIALNSWDVSDPELPTYFVIYQRTEEEYRLHVFVSDSAANRFETLKKEIMTLAPSARKLEVADDIFSIGCSPDEARAILKFL